MSQDRSNVYNGYYFKSDSETGPHDDWVRSFYSIYNPFGVVIAEAKTELDAEMICVAMNATSASFNEGNDRIKQSLEGTIIGILMLWKDFKNSLILPKSDHR